MKPAATPLGLHLARVSREVARAFDEALVEAGGSLPVWVVLLNLKARDGTNQRQLADAAGISEATLTHHLNLLDAQGLVTRRRDPANRRVHVVELTPEGDALFQRLVGAAMGFDRRLRRGVSDADATRLARLLDRLSDNVSD